MAERKKKQAAAAAGMAYNDDDDDDDGEWTEKSEFGRRSGKVSSKRKSRSKARGGDRRGAGRRNERGWRRREFTPSPVSSSGSPGWSTSRNTEDQKGKRKSIKKVARSPQPYSTYLRPRLFVQ